MIELDPPSTKNYPESAELTVQEVLMEGFRQKDELEQLQNKIPAPSTRLVVPTPLQPKLSELETRELDMLQLAGHEVHCAATCLEAIALASGAPILTTYKARGIVDDDSESLFREPHHRDEGASSPCRR